MVTGRDGQFSSAATADVTAQQDVTAQIARPMANTSIGQARPLMVAARSLAAIGRHVKVEGYRMPAGPSNAIVR
jgi:hypothetical protein